jgi:mono/diheme cytochrome c family protein
MAEKKGVGHAYNIDFLNVVFAASSLFLFLSVIWMVWDDYDREWKNTQRRFTQVEMEVTRLNLAQASRGIDRRKLTQLQQQHTAAQKAVDANRQTVEQLEDQLADKQAELYRVNQEAQFTKANYDVERYDYEVLRDHKDPGADDKQRQVEELRQRLQELNLQVERLSAERDALQRKLGEFTGKVADAVKAMAEMRLEETRLERRLETIAPSPVKTLFRDAPLLDFMAPTIKIQQVMTPNIVDDVNFTRVPKMDRCTTCHLAIDRRGYEKYPQPFRTHPNLELFLASDSPHPLDQIGCTVCHEGMGQSVSFRDASHTPANAKQRAEWAETHDWEEPHLWDYPMLPRGMTEASCAKCHKAESLLPGATRLNTAYAMYERAGCYACHKTRGFENLRKPGPMLTKIKGKLTPEWVATWIRNPRAVKPSTWMPKPWYTSNSSSPEDARRNEAEIDATVTYLFANSEEHAVAVPNPPRGDAASGQKIVESVGCLGCHISGDMKRIEAGPRRTFGQPLQNIGNKTTYEWLFDWVRDPRHYSPGTYMPDLRLTDQQVADVASYLMTLKGPAGETAKASADPKAADEVLLDYLRSTMPTEQARATLAKMDEPTKKLELGRRAIGRYGCFSCHEIKGFETTQPIGIELSEEGSKLTSRLDFAFVHEIPHTKDAWFHQKVKEPRIFDRGRVLEPLEKLRMPDFGVTDEEAELFVTAIMSFQRDVQPQQARRTRSLRNDALVEGRNFVNRRNCVACHVIEGVGGEYQKLVAEPTLAPPLLTPEGAKVQHDWLYAFLRGPIAIRPWLQVRMPTFGLNDAEANMAIRYFGAVSNRMEAFRTFQETAVRATDLTGTGSELFTLLQCQKCHVLAEIPKDQPTANLAPDLRMATDRLQPDWILDWLRNPARIQPGTRMPSFWPNLPKSDFPQLGGDGELQIRAIRDHLLTLRGGPSPRRPAAAGAQVAAN